MSIGDSSGHVCIGIGCPICKIPRPKKKKKEKK